MSTESALLDAFRYHRRRSCHRVAREGLISSAMTPAFAALRLAREDVAKNVKRYSPKTFHVNSRVGAADANGARWIEDPSDCGFRLVGSSFDVIGDHRGATGYYVDAERIGETIRGEVWQLPARKGRAVYVAAVTDAFNEKPRRVYLRKADLEFGEVGGSPWGEDDGAKRGAARFADGRAGREAEEARDYDSAWSAGSMWRDRKDERDSIRREALALVKEIRTACGVLSGFDHVKVALRGRLMSMRGDMSRLLGEMVALSSGEGIGRDYVGGFYPSKEHRDAFNEAAGLTVV
jgi:hypothetical protein